MKHIDLYAIHGLDRRMPPAEIGQRLTEILNRTQDPVARNRIETARTVLANPSVRARYDAQLNDPAAPPITEQTLAQLAGGPAPAAPAQGSGLTKTLGRPKILAGIAAALALLLVVIVTAVSCSSGGDSNSSNTDGQSPRSADNGAHSSESNGGFVPINTDLDLAQWTSKSKDEPPKLALQLTKAIDLPPEFSELSNSDPSCVPGSIPGYPFNEPLEGLFQLRGGSVALICGGETDKSDSSQARVLGVYAVTVNATGQIVDTQATTASRNSNQISGKITLDYFDLPEKSLNAQYFRVQGSDGITIPTGSTGLTDDMVYVVQALPDAFDENIVWVLLRASDKLYQAKVVTGQ